MVEKRGFGSLGNEADPPEMKRRRISSDQTADRFIPVRSAMDWDLAQTLLVGPGRTRLSSAPMTPYQECIQKAMCNGRSRLLAFNSNLLTTSPPPPAGASWRDESAKLEKRHVLRTPVESRHCENIADDYALNLLDWGSNNILAMAIGEGVHLWNYSDKSTSQLMELEDTGYITSVSWSPSGSHVATGLDDSTVLLWDATTSRLLRIIRGAHRNSRIGAISWNDHTLATAGKKIITYDLRAKGHIFRTVGRHQGEVCALKWSESGRHLASAAADGFVCVWDLRSTGKGQWQHRFNSHRDSVKALAWCPLKSNLLVSGGGGTDRHVVFWNTHTGSQFGLMDTGSQVGEILWSRDGREFLISHGPPENQLTLWKYPSMVKLADLTGHELPVLFMSQSPDGSMVASVGGEEALLIWKDVFPKHASKKSFSEPFAAFSAYSGIR